MQQGPQAMGAALKLNWKTNTYISFMGYNSQLKPLFVFSRSRNQYYAKYVYFISGGILFKASGASVQHCGRAMQVSILGGMVLGQRVAMPAWPAWSLWALGALSLIFAVVAVCTGVPTY